MFFADGALYSVVDGIFIGKYLGENALAGVAAAVSGVLTIILAKTMKLEAQSGKNE